MEQDSSEPSASGSDSALPAETSIQSPSFSMQPDPIGLDPIPGPQPAGEDVKDSEEFDAIQVEFAKQFNPELKSAFDPNRVINLATFLLTTKGKNILVCCYLILGLARQNKIQGLNQGLGNLINLIDQFWETLFPGLDRIRARRNAIEWLRTELTTFLANTEFDPQPIALIESIKDRITLLDKKLLDKDSDSPPLRSLISYLDQVPLLAEKPPEVVKPIVEDSANSDASPTQVSQSSDDPNADASKLNPDLVVPEIKNADDALKALDVVNNGLIRIADALLAQNIVDPLPYRVLRMAIWSSIADYPTIYDGRTQIPPPIPQLRSSLITMAANPSPNDLIIFCESQAANSWFWLDVHRVAEEGLNKLGAPGELAAKEIRLAVSNLIGRLPDLPSYLFNDGSPFAEPETLDWLENLSKNSAVGSTKKAGKTKPAASVDLSASLADAQKQVLSGLWPAAIKTMQSRVDLATNERDRLLARSQLFEMVLTRDPPVNMVPLAESLLEVIQKHHLTSWDPELALGVLKSIYIGLVRDVNAAELAKQTLLQIGQISDQDLFNVISNS